MKKRKIKHKVFLQPLQRDTPKAETKICSLKISCEGKPLPNTPEYFSKSKSCCKRCDAIMAKRRREEKISYMANFFF